MSIADQTCLHALKEVLIPLEHGSAYGLGVRPRNSLYCEYEWLQKIIMIETRTLLYRVKSKAMW